VGKKLKAIEEMARELELTNIQTHHGRVEEMVYMENDYGSEKGSHKHAYDVCVGRSVTALPRFCFWIQDLLKQKNKHDAMKKTVGDQGQGGEKTIDHNNSEDGGKLVYIIGGDIENAVINRVAMDVSIDQLLHYDGASDKRALVFQAEDVSSIAKESGEKSLSSQHTLKKNRKQRNSKRNVKGAWAKRNNSVKKERGYDDFQRYDGC